MSGKSRTEANGSTGLEIAVIGMAGRFPGAGNIREFWENLKNGVESLSFLTVEELKELDLDRDFLENPNYVNAKGGILKNKEYYDASFFGYTPDEAELLDPQVRIFHECCWEALENAVYDPGTYNGLIGLYAGAAPNFNWEFRAFLTGKSSEMGFFAASLLTEKDMLCTNTSYKLDLKGPSVLVQTACSTSLVAIHLACQAIINGECDMALAGGVNILSDEPGGYIYQEGMILSPDGHCRAFDANSKGTVPGEGCAVVVLKLSEDALADGDHIHALVKGSAINNDGTNRSHYTAPSRVGQTEVIIAARQMAEVAPETISYVETHGTGTSLGDPIEIDALTQAFAVPNKNYCAIGSVKSNIGHLGCAAGVAGFIKAVLVLKHKLIPPSINFQIPNPQIDFINSPFYVNPRLSELERADYPLKAAVSSLGLGGTNAHVILEESPEGTGGLAPLVNADTLKKYQLILLSAKTPTALDKMTKNLAEYFKTSLLNHGNHENPINPGLTLADAAYTLQVGRKDFNHRWMTVCSSVGEAVEALTSPGVGETNIVAPEEEIPTAEKIEPFADRDSLTQIGRSWLRGRKINWQKLYPHEKRYRVPLPGYPFERQRYWLDIRGNIFQMSAAAGMNSQSNQGINTNTADWFYLPTWKRTMLKPQKKPNAPGKFSWLLFANELSICHLLMEKLKEKKQQVVVVKMGDKFSRQEQLVYTIDPRESSHYDELFNQLRTGEVLPNKIIHLWNLTGENSCELNPEYFDRVQYPGFYSLLYIAKAIGKQDIAREVQVTFLTDYLQDVLGEESLCPGKAPVLGLLKVIPLEYPNISCSHVDISMPAPGSSTEAVLVDRLGDELAAARGEPVVAFRNNQRWVQVFDPLLLEEPGEKQAGLRKNGVYLVTGGIGKLGLVFSRLLARGEGTKLVLTGRSDFPAREKWDQWLSQHDEDDPVTQKIKNLQKLEEIGTAVIYLKADAADKEQMQRVVAQAEETFGSINGVIHAAGITGESAFQSLRELSPEHCRKLFQAKVYGLMILEELFKEKGLDFFWVMSSLSSILGGLNLGAFSAANSFVDVFVKQHNRLNQRGPVWVGLNWEQMEPQISTAAFERLFFMENVQQIAASVGGNLQARVDDWINLKPVRNENSHIPDIKKKPGIYPRPRLSTPYTAPGNPLEEALVWAWIDLFGYEEIGIHDDFFLLGGDSLRVITAVSKIQKRLKVLIPIQEFFEHPTIKELAQYILEKPGEEIYTPIEPTEKKEYYSLTSGQKRLYVLQQMDENSTSYNIFTTIMLEGNTLGARLEKTFRKLIHRHGCLRTSFEVVDNEPVQRMHNRVDFSIDSYDLTDSGSETPDHSPDPDSSGNPLEQLVKNCIRPFDLSQAPLVRVGLIRTHQSNYVLVGDMHHIASDGYSMGILVKEFVTLYAGKKLSPLKIHYTDYCQWLKKGNIQPSLQEQEEYWLKQFTGDIPELQLPTDYERPTRQSFEGDMVDFMLDREESAGLQEIASKANVTLFMVLMAVYNMLLAKLSGQEDIVVGTGIVGRRHEELQKIIGMFVNTLCIRNYPGRAKTFNRFLNEVKEKTLLAYQNQDYQFEELVEKVYPNRKRNRNPLFDAAIVSQDIAVEDIAVQDITVEAENSTETASNSLNAKPYPHKSKVAKFDITLLYQSIEDKFLLIFEYCTKLFKRDTILRFTLYFKEILAQVIENQDIKLEAVTISHHLLKAGSYNPGMDLGF